MSRSVVNAYADASQTALTATWLQNEDLETITPNTTSVYILMATSGSYPVDSQFVWDGSAYVQLEENETIIIPSGGGSPTPGPSPGPAGTTNYNDLTNKPKIEGVTLVGNKTFAELNLPSLTNLEIESLLT